MKLPAMLMMVALANASVFGQTIVDFFETIPDSSIFGLSKDIRTKIIRHSRGLKIDSLRDADTICVKFAKIDTSGLPNGYLKVTGFLKSYIELRCWNLKNSKKLIAVYTESCGPVCTMDRFDFYEYNGKSFKPIDRKLVIPDIFADFFVGNYKEQLVKMEKADVLVSLLFELPSKGENIVAKWGNEGSKDVYEAYGKGDRMDLIWTGKKFSKGRLYWRQ
ncbi:MAG: hypothetical protein IPN71_06245 [Fibrobacteres bacterium]|nr:hypothetical protein [Fibrobacterota bacterium]